MEFSMEKNEMFVRSHIDTSSEDEIILPLSERIKNLSQIANKKSFSSLKSHNVSAHSISDSDDDDAPAFISNNINSDDEDLVLPSLAFNLENCLQSTHDTVSSRSPIKVKNLPVLVDLESDEESREVEVPIQVTKRSKASPKNKQNADNLKKEKQEQRLKERELKKKEKELDKALKAAEREVQKNSKPEEYLKVMKVVIDGNLVSQDDSNEFFNELDSNNLDYNIEVNHINLSVVWYRRVTHISVENEQVCKDEREELQSTLVLFIPNKDFIEMVHTSLQRNKGKEFGGKTLLEHLTGIKSIFPLMDVTCVTVGLDTYLRVIKASSSVEDDVIKSLAKRVSKSSIEEAMIEVQLQSFVNFKSLMSMKEFATLLHHYTKAIAAAPSKKEKNEQKALAFSWYADGDSSCPVKLEKDGSGGIKLWKQQIQQFNNVGNQVAESIVAKYPSPKLLLNAYKNCSSVQEAQKLLQDIVVRRDYGPLGTHRRIGPELSYKIYLFFTSVDGEQLLQR